MDEIGQLLERYWPHIVLLVSIVASVATAIHAAMTKQDVRAAIGWVAVVIFSPLLGATFYLFAGINRVRRERVTQQRRLAEQGYESVASLEVKHLGDGFDEHIKPLRRLGNEINSNVLLRGNQIQVLSGGDQTYPAMLEIIAAAQTSIALQTYIFDHDGIGIRIAQALIDAQQRGVKVRVLIDAVGAKYSRPPITRMLQESGVKVGLFLPTAIGIRLVYANMRSHRKLLVVDGQHALTGGMNIREGFMREFAGDDVAVDTHFRVNGPVARHLMESFAHDWEFTTGERLEGEAWFSPAEAASTGEGVPIRVVLSGPDRAIGRNQSMLLGALSVARHHVRIQSPYFLPEPVLIGALVTAARRGVRVDVVIPANNNLKLVSAAMEAQLDLMLHGGVHVWRAHGSFDHSKLMTVDDQWCYVGSSNVDPRSQRLNFELDLEVFDRTLARDIAAVIDSKIHNARRATLAELANRPFWVRLRNRFIWLASPLL
ncbi:MAG: cardiolipin synthase [Burkholderiaceae bacterium]|nr:cardiolipin synthase [Burkholderiaceae bacterium]MCD8516581.1 cardiolipin synthase [Burkholderiaceae bacterium]MCD8537295.1 cardiolipin synthase [Burkholderiaceae bacterium]MCD8565195.1 cardiolipin synthase [Burkholderiaceae bacterium]